MAMPFIFGNHQYPFLVFRSVSVINRRSISHALRSRERFLSGSRSWRPPRASARKAAGDDEPGKKIRGTAIVRNTK